MKTAVIINPKSAAGQTMKLWRDIKLELQKKLSSFEVFMTEFPRHATELSQYLSEKKYERIIVMGGDGSLHEVVNGLMNESGQLIYPEIKVGVLNSGRGCDFARSISVPADPYKNIEILAQSKIKKVDLGKVTYFTSKGSKVEYFLNSFSYVLGGDVCRRVTRARSYLPPSAMYFAASFAGLVAAKPAQLEIQVPGQEPIHGDFYNLFVMNGKFSGGGMKWAPNAEVNDGLLDMMLVREMSKIKLSLSGSKIYDGTFDQVEGVSSFQGTEIRIHAKQPYSMELDGEVLESDDIRIEILPSVLNFIC